MILLSAQLPMTSCAVMKASGPLPCGTPVNTLFANDSSGTWRRLTRMLRWESWKSLTTAWRAAASSPR